MASGTLTRTKGAQPATPSSGLSTSFVNTEGRVQEIGSDGVLRTLSDGARPNWLVNSGFWFAQRQAPASAVTYSSTAGRAFTADQWAVTNENASATFQRTDTQAAPESGLQGRFYGTFLKITATGKFEVSQCIEGMNANAIRGRSVRFQVWMKGTASQTVRLGVIQLTSAGTIDTIPATYISAHNGNGTDPTLGANLSYIAPKSGVTGDNCTTNGNAADCSVTTAWQRFGHVFDIPSNCKNVIVMLWTNAQLTAANGFSVSQTSLTDGMELQDWTPDTYDSEWARCARFITKTFNIDTDPATNPGVNTGEHKWAKVVAAATAARSPTWYFPVRMRIAPTITRKNPAAAGVEVRDETNNVDCTASATVAGGESGVSFTCTGNAATVAEGILGIHILADASL